jgi:hypothetical protein
MIEALLDSKGCDEEFQEAVYFERRIQLKNGLHF